MDAKSIKAAQIAAAKERGEDDPYLNPNHHPGKTSNSGLGIAAKIKAAQIAAAKERGEEDPYLNQTPKPTALAIQLLGDLKHYQDLLKVDLNKISTAKTLDEKAQMKAVLLPQYLPFIEQYCADKSDTPNNVAVQVMIWLLDSGDIERGLALALYLIETGNQHMPERFKRQDLETFICDFMGGWAVDLLKQEQSPSPYLDDLADVLRLGKWDVHPLCYSKIYVILAKHKELSGDYQEGITLCKLAMDANPESHGCKK